MAHYIGIDIIEVDRIERAVARWGDRFLRRIYTDRELDLYRARPDSLATRFAAKEAVMKVLKKGWSAISWRDIEITSGSHGEPLLSLYGRAKSEAGLLDLTEIAISLSHCQQYAAASVLGVSRDKS